ncbi:hypothetical protein Purlil1_4955 [Purpureocillium lilacinum]|uniref:Uncharacterized protein n=1 Tax=Purpureocillium lilacinum TaxID=33203 RepID=A0ABR0C3U7_PURLI|nr:hypothetical protein Purlil1_4955 [Purpureocillium lilacinum]
MVTVPKDFVGGCARTENDLDATSSTWERSRQSTGMDLSDTIVCLGALKGSTRGRDELMTSVETVTLVSMLQSLPLIASTCAAGQTSRQRSANWKRRKAPTNKHRKAGAGEMGPEMQARTQQGKGAQAICPLASERHPPWPSRLPVNRQYLERPGANDGDDDDFVLPRAVTASPLPASVLLSIAPHGEHYKVSAFSGRVELSRQTLCTTSPVVFSTRFIPWSHQCSPDLLGLLHLPPSSPTAAASRCFIAPLPIRPLVSSPVIRRQHRPTTTASLAISTTTLPQQFPEAPARTDMNLLTAPAI